MKYLINSHGCSWWTWGVPDRGEWSQWRLPSNSAAPLLSAGDFSRDGRLVSELQVGMHFCWSYYRAGVSRRTGQAAGEKEKLRDVKALEQDALKITQENLWWTHQDSGNWSIATRTREKKDFGISTEGEVNKQSAVTESRSNEEA